MKSFLIKIEPTNYIFEVFGDGSTGTELHWSDNPPVGRAKGAFAVALPDLEIGEKFSATVCFTDTPIEEQNAFSKHVIDTFDGKIEISDVVESQVAGSEGFVGALYSLPWSGSTEISLSAPKGFTKNSEGELVPLSLHLTFSPASET
ncbi:hypothetical protein ACLI1L_001756 [Corynebacterium sp. LaCa117]|uniref:hypothetical protein n=1 Tax=Corynebacterium TaxID=1716 RepID=UPI000A3B4108|nr:hypothetical protein [Corynebacterium kefirresidentii]OUJ23705.1 hypothetical protein CBI45_04825 [Corynebacterium kefirresidentii]